MSKTKNDGDPATGNAVEPLNATPVGPPATPTVSGTFEPVPVYSVDASAPLSETHQGVEPVALRPAVSPHAFTSVPSAGFAPIANWSETSGLAV